MNILEPFKDYLDKVSKYGFVLDIGTGNAEMATALANKGYRCITIEKNQKAFSAAKHRICNGGYRVEPLLLNLDARNLPFLDNSFDMVVVYRSLHHIKDAEQAIHEMVRVCKPGQFVIIIEIEKHKREAMDFLSSYKGTTHPKTISIDEIVDCLKSMDDGALIEKLDCEIGTVCIFHKNGQSSLLLESERTEALVHRDGHNEYYYDYRCNDLWVLDLENRQRTQLFKKVIVDSKPKDSLCLNLTNRCNLGCKYCYENVEPYKIAEEEMSEEIAIKAIEAFSRTNPDINVILFGGEPLLNRPLIEKLLQMYKNTVKFQINTNATLLEIETLKMLLDAGTDVSISIDGSASVHNSCRVYKNGKNTFEDIEKFLKFVPPEEIQKLTARMTVTKNTVSLLNEIESVFKMGFRKIEFSFVQGGEELAESGENIAVWKEEMPTICKMAMDGWLTGERSILPIQKIYQKLLIDTEFDETCTAGSRLFSVQPTGEINPCFRVTDTVIGKESFTDLNTEKLNDFIERKAAIRKFLCNGCMAFQMCGGFCPCDLSTAIKIQPLRCDLIIHLVNCAIRIFVQTYLSDPQKIAEKKRKTELIDFLNKMRKEKDD